MNQRIYHGTYSIYDFATAIIAHFNRGNLRVQQYQQGEKVYLQIATVSGARSGGHTALTVAIQSVEDGIGIEVSEQAWMGVAASLGMSALSIFQNPLNLLSRIDDIAQDIQNLQLTQEVWDIIEATARSLGASTMLSERLQRVCCDYCNTANLVGASHCIACGAPLGNLQPQTCKKCGFILLRDEPACPNCGTEIT